MIVVCSSCQARFKVADEKIGPRGSKVRCSKCQTVFIVHKELGVMPVGAAPPAAPAAPRPAPARPPDGGLDLDLEGTPGKGLRPNGMVANPFGAPADPFVAAAPPSPPPQDVSPPDPFAAGADPFAAQPPAPTEGAPAADPFGAADPFAASPSPFGTVDPFVAAVAPRAPGLPTSAVTDLSDLLGPSSPPAASAPPPPAGADPEMEAASPPEAGPDPSGILDAGYFDASAAAKAAAPDAGIALTERTPPPIPAASSMPGMGDFAGADPFGEPLPGASPEASTPLETAGEDAFAEAAAAPAPPPAAPPPRTQTVPAVVVAEPSAASELAAAAPRPPSRVRAVVVNALSLAALVAVALGFFALSRGEQAGSLLRRSADGAAATPYSASGLRTGLYDRLDAPPVLFVAGTAVSNGTAPVAALRVRVEVLRGDVVVARGEARAGAIPTPEELSSARDAAALAAAAARSVAGAPAEVKPGASLPFLVAIAEYPPDVAGSRVRVSVEPFTPEPAPPPAEGARPAPDAEPPPEAPKAP